MPTRIAALTLVALVTIHPGTYAQGLPLQAPAQSLPIPAQSSPKRVLGPDRPLSEKLRSPRDTLQTLYYAIDVYDWHPSVIADAVACLELGDSMPADSASAALLAVQLECVLNSLEIALAGVPDRPDCEPVIFKMSEDRAKVHD